MKVMKQKSVRTTIYVIVSLGHLDFYFLNSMVGEVEISGMRIIYPLSIEICTFTFFAIKLESYEIDLMV